jgi:hypothetical protein
MYQKIIPIKENPDQRYSYPAEIIPLDENSHFLCPDKIATHSPDASYQKSSESEHIYWNTLVRYFPGSGYVPKKIQKEIIVSIGCGEAHDAGCNFTYFIKNINRGAHLYGIDIRESSIKKAVRKYIHNARVHFIQGDACGMAQRNDLPRPIDIALVRHPSVRNRNEHWGDVFIQTYELLREKGVIFITLYREIEYEKTLEILNEKKLPVVFKEKNIFGKPLYDLELLYRSPGFDPIDDAFLYINSCIYLQDGYIIIVRKDQDVPILNGSPS